MKNISDEIEKVLRRGSIEKIAILDELLKEDMTTFTTVTASGVLSQTGKELGGTISSLSRTKINGEPLIVPVGKAEQGTLWKINNRIATKEIIQEAVENILKDREQFDT